MHYLFIHLFIYLKSNRTRNTTKERKGKRETAKQWLNFRHAAQSSIHDV